MKFCDLVCRNLNRVTCVQLVVAALACVAAAARPEQVYLPPRAGPPAPSAPPHSSAAAPAASARADILRYENDIDSEGWHYAYETSDGTRAEQNGRVVPAAAAAEGGSVQVSGAFSYVGDDGHTYSVTYTADETGFHPSGAHLPTPPLIPDDILRSLQLTAPTHPDGQYSRQKSSYDADAGY